MLALIYPPGNLAIKRRTAASAVLVLALGLTLAFWLLPIPDQALLGNLQSIMQPLTLLGLTSGTLLLGGIILLRHERKKRLRLEATLGRQSAELRAQTATAAVLARDVEAARAEVQRFNDFLERGRVQERLSDLQISKTALRVEAVRREQTAISLHESQSELVLARDEIERALAEHTQELERSNHELEQFAYVASHDLQEPLRAISGCVEILKLRYAPQLDERGHELIAHAVAGVGRMRQLIDDLLEYSRVRRGAAFAPVSAETALQEALKQLESAINRTGATIEHEELPTVCADAGQLVQLLQNIIGNALKYRGVAAPQIRISALRAELIWIFAVRDNGIGIESQYFERIFSIFQRLHTRDEYPGTGIGLALCRRIVEQAGGSIWIESEPGAGSTFYFTLPAVA